MREVKSLLKVCVFFAQIICVKPKLLLYCSSIKKTPGMILEQIKIDETLHSFLLAAKFKQEDMSEGKNFSNEE